MDNNIYTDIIGSGAYFPIQVSQNQDGTAGWKPTVADPKLIVENLTSIFVYNIGERFNQEDFGTRISECVEEPNTQALSFLVNHFIKEAIEKYEKRVTYSHSNIVIDGSTINIEFYYKINGTDMVGSGSLTYNLNK